MKQLRVLLLPPGWDYASPLQGFPQQYVTGTHFIHLGGGRETMWGKVSCLRKQQYTCGLPLMQGNKNVHFHHSPKSDQLNKQSRTIPCIYFSALTLPVLHRHQWLECYKTFLPLYSKAWTSPLLPVSIILIFQMTRNPWSHFLWYGPNPKPE